MKRHYLLGVLVLGGLACRTATPRPASSTGGSVASSTKTPGPDADASDEQRRAAIETERRPAEDRARDADRRPLEVLRFFGIAPGMKVAEIMTGRGYYAEILSRVVGPRGVVYAHNNRYVLERFAAEPLAKRLARLELRNVVRLDAELETPGLPAGQLDAVLMILFYHDTYWMGADRARMNRAIFRALKPGGVYGVIDHRAAAGAGRQQVKSLHRVEPALVKREILAAGFSFAGESPILRHPEDDLSGNVFEPKLRGKTDRFVWRFVKPQ